MAMGAFQGIPAYRNLIRGLDTNVIHVFKGLNIYTSFPNIGPESALQLLNVIVSRTGGLSKLRFPVQLASMNAQGVAVGPSRIFDFQQAAGARHLVCFQGTKLNIFDINAAYALLLNDTNAFYSGPVLVDGVSSNNLFFFINGAVAFKWIGSAVPGGPLELWGIDPPLAAPTLGAPVGGALTFTQGGRKYGYAYGNSTTGHIGNMSPASVSSGNLTAQNQPLTAIASLDNQVDTLYWYGTLDGGADYYLITSGPFAGLLNYTDSTPDVTIAGNTKAQFINNRPLLGKYLTKYQGRIFIMNLIGAAQDIIYSGYEQIFTGRPEESFPPNNRLRLAVGANAIAGGGVIQAGVIAFDNDNHMFMFRGTVEDIVTNNPLLFSAYLEELPWKMGLANHYTVDASPYGLIWWGSDLTINIFNGQNIPQCMSDSVQPLLNLATPTKIGNARGKYLNWLDREWYVFTFSYNGSTTNNRILFFDLYPDPEMNMGVFVSDLEADDVNIIEDTNGLRQLCITQSGNVLKVLISPDTQSGLSPNPIAPTGATLAAYYQTGYFGNEAPQTRRMMRWSSFIHDIPAPGPVITGYLVSEEQGYTFQNPLIKLLDFDGYKVTVNVKGRRMSYLINWPSADASGNLIELVHNSRATGEI